MAPAVTIGMVRPKPEPGPCTFMPGSAELDKLIEFPVESTQLANVTLLMGDV